MITSNLNLVEPSKGVKVFGPIGCVNAGILDGFSGVNHHTVADINAHMCYGVRRTVGSLKKNQIARLGVCPGNWRAGIV